MKPDRTFFADRHQTWSGWRRDLHQHPELAYKEHRTSNFVAERLATVGVEVHRGYGGTGVVGVLTNGDGPNIGLRADMDALPIHEAGDRPYRSINSGVMHACGHDGHTTMLLAAAEYLAATRRFSGTTTFIFQPAEEAEAGAKRMIEDGLFEAHPVDTVYAIHNWPDLEEGAIACLAGPQMAGFDTFDITITGKGSHAAMPHHGSDTVLGAGQLLVALQTVVSRNVDPQSAGVVSVTQVHGGETYNVLPQEVLLAGCTRYFDEGVQGLIRSRVREICSGVGVTQSLHIALDYRAVYPPTINDAASQQRVLNAARMIAHQDNIYSELPPSMASEDFAFMLNDVPGAYIWLGNGPVDTFGTLHSPTFDFNDAILPVGAQLLANLVEGSKK